MGACTCTLSIVVLTQIAVGASQLHVHTCMNVSVCVGDRYVEGSFGRGTRTTATV